MELTSSADTIVLSKAAGTNTTDPKCVVFLREETFQSGGRLETPDVQRTTIPGTSEVTVLTGPAANVASRRWVEKLWVYNDDAIDHTFLVGHRRSGTTYLIKKLVLPAGWSAEYTGES